MLKRIAIIALVAVSLASAKTYTFVVSDVAQAGSVQLKPGTYNLKVNGSDVVLVNSVGQKIEVNAKIEAADQKFDNTAIATTKEGGTSRILFVNLGGTRSKVVFEEPSESSGPVSEAAR